MVPGPAPICSMPYFIRHTSDARPIEASQWFPGQELPGVSSESAGHPGTGSLLPVPPHAHVHTRKGTLTVFASDWIITEPNGELHVCQHRLFEPNYARLAVDTETGPAAA